MAKLINHKSVASRLLTTSALVGAASLAAIPQAALAQDAESAADETDNSNVIIVTARFREENIQDVPIAITAFDEETFAKRAIENLDDVARLTPGLSFEDFSGGFATPVIRGQSQTRITALEQNVSTFLGGVYIPRAWAIDLGSLNLQRVEVVKGPQSARYGRNAFSGAINYVPFTAELADRDLSGTISATVGTDERFDASARINFSPNDYFALAFSYNNSSSDGTWDNIHPFADLDLDEGTEGNAGGWDNEAWSVSALVEPSDAISFEASYHRFEVENEARAGQNNDESARVLNCGSTIAGNPRLFCGELPEATDQAIVDPRAVGVISDTDIFRAAVNLSPTDSLDLSYVFGLVQGEVLAGGSSETNQAECFPNFFSNLNVAFGAPNVPSGMCAFTITPVGDIDYDSHEFRAVYDTGSSLRFEFGAFLSNGEDRDLFAFASPPPVSDDPASQVTVRSLITNSGGNFIETDVTAFFGSAEWSSADDRLRVGIEGRYTENDITGSSLGDPTQPVLNETFSFFTPRFSVDYQLTDDSLVYGSIARGAKTGGFNPSAIQDPADPDRFADNLTFDPEFNWTFEVGLKSQFFDNRLALNAAFFYTDWTGLQLNAPDPGGDGINVTNITLNLGDARVYGLELDAVFEVTDNFTLDGSFSIVDNRYKDGTIDSRFATPASDFFAATIGGAFGTPAPASPCDDIVCSSDGDVGGNRIERTPPIQATFGAEYADVTGDVEWFVRTDLSWQDEFYATPVNLATIPSRFLVSASAGLTYEEFDLNFWVRNLTDETYVSNSFAVIIPFGNAYNTFFGDRRSFGATAKVNF